MFNEKNKGRKTYNRRYAKKVATKSVIRCVLFMAVGCGCITYQKTVIDPKGFTEIMETKGFSIVENPEAYGSIKLKVACIATSPSGEYQM